MDESSDTRPDDRSASPPPIGPFAGALSLSRLRARTRSRRQVLRGLAVAGIVLIGSAIGAALAPPVNTQVGPVQAQIQVRPSVSGGVKVLLPPAGEVVFDTHWTPVAVEARVLTVDPTQARTLLASPAALRTLQASAPGELRSATLRAALYTILSAMLGAGGLAGLVYRRRWRRIALSLGLVTGMIGTIGGVTLATFDIDRFAQPRFTGLLSQAPYVAGQAGGVLERLESYRAGVADIVQAVTTLYAMSGRLPTEVTTGTADTVTLLHVSDLHLNPLGFDLVQRLVKEFGVDVVVDTGDITTWGTDVESSTLSWIGRLDVPYVFVRGNHDSRRTQQLIASYPNAVVLDGTVREVAGLRIAGIGDPVFTPDGPGRPATAAPPAAAPATSVREAPSASASAASVAPSVAPAPAGAGRAVPSVSPDDPQYQAGARLAEAIRSWNEARPTAPVEIAAVHEPYAIGPLLGAVPLVLTGHFHSRDVTVEKTSGTRVMREGSTGGAGISADFRAIQEGSPLPLEATLIYIARSGDRVGQVVAYDEVTVGGFGLASASVERTVVRPEPAPSPTPTPDSPQGPASGPSATAAEAARVPSPP